MSAALHAPRGEGIFLDHLAHWIPDMGAGAADLQRLGFRLTPYTEHRHSPAPGAPVEPAGTANHCIMLHEGYLEILTATRDTALAAEVRAAMARHTGVHLCAFCVNDAQIEHRRLVAQGFPQRPTVELARETQLADGRHATLRFTVIRPQPGLLPEGRVQFLTHHTPELLWEPRWLDHPNGTQALTDVLFVCPDAAQGARRYARYLRSEVRPGGDGTWTLALQRGTLTLASPAAAGRALAGLALHAPPCMAGYALRSRDLAATRRYLVDAGFSPGATRGGALVLQLPASLGGIVVFHDGSGPPWLRPADNP